MGPPLQGRVGAGPAGRAAPRLGGSASGWLRLDFGWISAWISWTSAGFHSLGLRFGFDLDSGFRLDFGWILILAGFLI